MHSISGINTWNTPVSLDGTLTATEFVGIGVEPNPVATAANNNTYFTNDYSLTINGVISNNGPDVGLLQKVDKGQLILTAANTYGILTNEVNDVTTDIAAGWITIENSKALGNPGLVSTPQTLIPYTEVDNGGALHLKTTQANPLNLVYNLILTGLGVTDPFGLINQAGDLENIDGANTFAGIIQLGSVPGIFSAGIGVEQVFPLSATDTIPSQLTLTGYLENDSVSGTVGGLEKLGSQRLIIQGVGSYTGPVDIVEGPLLAQSNTALGAGGNNATGATGSSTTVEAATPTVQNLILTGALAGTQFTLTVHGIAATGDFTATTAPITYTAAAGAGVTADTAAIQKALSNLPAVLAANGGTGGAITVTQIAPGDYTVTFGGLLAGYDEQVSGVVTSPVSATSSTGLPTTPTFSETQTLARSSAPRPAPRSPCLTMGSRRARSPSRRRPGPERLPTRWRSRRR